MICTSRSVAYLRSRLTSDLNVIYSYMTMATDGPCMATVYKIEYCTMYTAHTFYIDLDNVISLQWGGKCCHITSVPTFWLLQSSKLLNILLIMCRCWQGCWGERVWVSKTLPEARGAGFYWPTRALLAGSLFLFFQQNAGTIPSCSYYCSSLILYNCTGLQNLVNGAGQK